MIVKEIEKLRKQLNDMAVTYDFNNEEILRLSMELDRLILRYFEGTSTDKNSK